LRVALISAFLAVLGAGSLVADDKPETQRVVPYEKLRNPGEVREFEIAPGVNMKFCWIPPGKGTLGSPNSETDRRDDEVEHEYASKGYWLGKFPVMQGQWQAVMGNNPSYFSRGGRAKENVTNLDTTRFPVEEVSWDDCAKFLAKLNDRGGAEKIFGKRGKFVLPNEDEWEFACRGNRGNGRAFYVGGMLNGKQANCDGSQPNGTEATGPCMGRTTEVGAYEHEAPHPWGLCDMHGNVYQWCENWYDGKQDERVLRGGCWMNAAWYCRAARRPAAEPGFRNYQGALGLRVCFRLD
jgi:formylglycine-generating enzyme